MFYKSLIVASLLAIAAVSFSAEGEQKKQRKMECLYEAQRVQMQEILQLREQLHSKHLALIESVKTSNPELAEKMLKRTEMRKERREERHEDRKQKHQQKRQGCDIRPEAE